MECPQCARARVSETTRDEARKQDYRDSLNFRAARTILAPNLTEVITFIATRSLHFYLQQILFRSKYCWVLNELAGKYAFS